ncbi:MAG TPA: hypothetical protein VHL59_07410, partial [Thermoanaerobaculia bacterium]|nr:hypothetical protein [Thermoanaerobaculia bacterium]
AIGLPKKTKPAPADVRRIEAQIARRSRKLELRELLDAHTARLEKLVAAKEKKRQDIVEVEEEEKREEAGGEVVDLLEVLSRSLGGPAKRKPARRAPASRKKRSATKKKSSKKRA